MEYGANMDSNTTHVANLDCPTVWIDHISYYQPSK